MKGLRYFLIPILILSLNYGCGGNSGEKKPDFQAAKTHSGRMLCASNLAYEILSENELNKKEPWYSGVSFESEPKLFLAGPANIHGCILGKCSSGIIVAFRGTLPPSPLTEASLADWFNNIFQLPPIGDSFVKGKIHSGFKDGLDLLWTEFYPELQKLASSYPDSTKISFTGHSKGGALAILAAARYQSIHPGSNIVITTFAAPKAGDSEFADALNKKKIPNGRWEAAGDMVPFLPPDFSFAILLNEIPIYRNTLGKKVDWKYSEAGKTKFISAEGNDEKNFFSIFSGQVLEFIKMLKDPKNGPAKLMKAHGCGCGSMYQKGVAPDLNCNVNN